MKLVASKIAHGNSEDAHSVYLYIMESGNANAHEFNLSLKGLEDLIIALAKVRMMAVIEQEKGLAISSNAKQEFIEQNIGIRKILMPPDDAKKDTSDTDIPF